MMNKAKIEGHLYDVMPFEDAIRYHQADALPQYAAIQEGDKIFPIRPKTESSPGAYIYKDITVFKQPDEDNRQFFTNNETFIDFDSSESLSQVIKKQDSLRSMERSILTNVDNVFQARIEPDDSSVMKGLKSAINSKHIDLDKYEQRFGVNYNNDKRLLNKPTITLSKLQTMLDALDMKGTLIIEDAAPDVPNPIGDRIVVPLSDVTGSEDGSDEDESA